MTAESALRFEALEEQAGRILAIFTAAGYERVAPSIIQPAGLFLDRIGETMRARTYIFCDANGEELCLRPDLTTPVCRLFLERHAQGAAGNEAKFCYNGPAFRMQEGKPDPLRPREFRQAGMEAFGNASPEADFEVMQLTLEAVRAAGVKNFTLKLGHLGLFSGLLSALDMPERWRARLRRSFWRPVAFARELRNLTEGAARQDAALQSLALSPEPETAEQQLLDHLDREGIPVIGLRRPAEIVRILQDRAADGRERPLPQASAGLIEAYLRIEGPLPQAMGAIEQLLGPFRGMLASHFELLRALQGRLAEFGVAAERTRFEADFGRAIEYYTGLVFQIEIEGAGIAGQIAGGGRYDGLLREISRGAVDLPAVGAAIHTERLLAAAQGRLP